MLGGLALVGLAGGLLWQNAADKAASGSAGPGPVHVHGLGVNPADGALFIATHTGLFRAGEGERTATRVGEGVQDTMGFTVVGPNHFLGSGHPDLTEDLPPLLGLIESVDAGLSWRPVSLLGEADFHVLRFAGSRLYGYDASNDRLLGSADGGRTWRTLSRPAPLIDLVVNPADRAHLVASGAGEDGSALFESTDGGESWTGASGAAGLHAWPAADRLYTVTETGEVFRSRDSGRGRELRGRIDGRPAALLARAPDDLYVALHDGTIQRSTDGGVTWAVRSTP